MPKARSAPASSASSSSSPLVIIAYVPVLHSGYRRLFDKYPAAQIYVLGIEIIAEFDQLRKELRALSPESAVAAIKGWGRAASVLTPALREQLAAQKPAIIMPDEDICHELAARHFAASPVVFETIFLRWDRRRMEADKDKPHPDHTISAEEFDRSLMQRTVAVGRRSSNLWRRVGAAIVRDGAVVLQASNRHQPTPHSNWIDGDPRINANRGVSIDVSTDLHAEARVVAEAARRGLKLDGTNMYVSVFPCPTCAKLIANVGIARLYYATGYAVLDGEEVLRAHGVELIHVTGVDTDDPTPGVWVPYPEKSRGKDSNKK